MTDNLIKRVYLDTSVFGGCFEPEFARWSNEVFRQVRRGIIYAVLSDVTAGELIKAPLPVRSLLSSLPVEHLIRQPVTPEIQALAEEYIKAKVVPPYCLSDALHAACAATMGMPILLSWNFKHLVGNARKAGFNAVNLLRGYGETDIRSPRDYLGDDLPGEE